MRKIVGAGWQVNVPNSYWNGRQPHSKTLFCGIDIIYKVSHKRIKIKVKKIYKFKVLGLMLSDETKINLFGSDGNFMVRRYKRGKCLVSVDGHDGGNVIV